MSKQTSFKLNIGLSSILLIFVVLCLVSFAILSLVSANADKKLSMKMLERSTIYYNACNQFESDCAKLYNELYTAYSQGYNESEYFQAIGESKLTYTYPLSDLQTLEITVELLYPHSISDTFYRVCSRKVVTDDTVVYDTHLNVIP